MQTQISIFKFQSSKEVRTAIHADGSIWFCLPDVANVLEISRSSDLLQVAKPAFVKNETSSKRGALDPAGVHKMYISYDSGKKQVTFVNEPNLYRVIFRSNKDEAVKFQNWVFDEVLPTIRKTGGYTTRTTTDDRTPLRQAVSLLVGKRGLDYSTAYTLVNQYMGTEHIDEIAFDDLPRAVAYVHNLMLNDMASNKLINNAQHLAWHTEFIYSWYKAIEEPFRALSPRLSAQIHDHIIHAKIAATGINKEIGFGGMNPAVIDKQVWSVGFDGLRF